MAGRTTGFCVALFLILTSVLAAQRRLDSISELRDCYLFEDTNVFELLHWFAHTINIDGNNVIRLTFNPNYDYGSHHYGNYEGMLYSPPWKYNYYTLGNIHQETGKPLPDYLVNARTRRPGWNRARIIFSANSHREIDQIFITEHHRQQYDPECTYEVSTHLLREFRRRNINEIRQLAGSSQRGNFGNTSYSQGMTYSNQNSFKPQANKGANRGDDDCMGCLCVCFGVVGLIIVVLLFFIVNVKK